MNKVFVYGSLLSGMGNHVLLSDTKSKMLGECRTPRQFAMIDLGYFPGIVPAEKEPVEILGEVYEVDDETLHRLDRLEGYNSSNPSYGLYNRIEIDTEFGKAFVYTYNNRHGFIPSRLVADGDWRKHVRNTKL
jgi:gamma-glutamylcyclotransferase (GGCT)/AIG2-like uncharacterized protein YtfP